MSPRPHFRIGHKVGELRAQLAYEDAETPVYIWVDRRWVPVEMAYAGRGGKLEGFFIIPVGEIEEPVREGCTHHSEPPAPEAKKECFCGAPSCFICHG